MGDLPELTPEHAARIRALPIADLTRDLVKRARERGASKTEAEDRAHAALLDLITKGVADWDYLVDPTAWAYLKKALKRARSREVRRAVRHRTDLDTEAVEESPPSSDSGPERLAMEREAATWAREELLRRLSGSPLAQEVVRLCMAEGRLYPAEIAERLGETIERIYECQKRIADEVAHVEQAAKRREGVKR